MEEEWRDIEGYQGLYLISDRGKVKSLYIRLNAGIRKLNIDRDGYNVIDLYNCGISKWFKVHRLVASAFIGNPDNNPVINHIDGNRVNNRVENLEWCTVAQNNSHTCILKPGVFSGENNGSAKYTNAEVLEIYKLAWEGNLRYWEITEKYGISRYRIMSIKHGGSWASITKHQTEPSQRKNTGVNNYKAKLSIDEICEIYRLSHSGMLSNAIIGNLYDVSTTTIHRIRNGSRYKDITATCEL